MPKQALHHLGHYVRTLAGMAGDRPESDQYLLRRFVSGREEPAFTALVQRHGTLVLQVAWRVLGDWHQAEEVFQATFLTLARKAGTIRQHDALASWLYAVSYRLALRARARSAKCEVCAAGRDTAVAVDPLDTLSAREFLAVLDEELQGLAEKYRAPLVLCYLREQTHEEAAQQLSCPPGTLRRRLQHGKELLRRRLERRGVTLSATALAAALTACAAHGTVSAALVVSTVTAVLPMVSAPGALAGVVSARVLELVEGAARATVAGKVKAVGAVLLVLVGLLTAAGWTACQEAGGVPEPAPVQSPVKQTVADIAEEPLLDAQGDPLPAGAVQRFGTLRFRTGGLAFGLAYAPNGKTLATINGHEIWIWDRASGKLLRRLAQPKNLVKDSRSSPFHLRFSPDGTCLAASYFENQVIVWDLAAGKPLFQCAGIVTLFSKDGRTLFTGGKRNSLIYQSREIRYFLSVDSIRRWDVVNGKELSPLGRGVPIALTADGKRLAAVTGKVGPDSRYFFVNSPLDQVISIWDTTTGKEVRQLPVRAGAVSAATFTPQGFCCFLGADYKKNSKASVLIWPDSEPQPRLLAVNGLENRPPSFSADGKRMAFYYSGGIRIWDIAAVKEERLLTVLTSWGFADEWVFSPTGAELAGGGRDGALVFWDLKTGKQLPTGEGHLAEAWSLALAPDGRFLCSSSNDGTLRLWDRRTGKQLQCWDHSSHFFSEVRFTPDGKHVAGSSGQKVWLRDVTTGQKVHEMGITLADHDFVRCLTLSPDGKYLAAGSTNEGHVALWETATGNRTWEFAGNSDTAIHGLAFSPDGKLLAVVGADPIIRFHDPATGELVQPVPLPQVPGGRVGNQTRISFSPDGRMLAYSQVEKVLLFELATGKVRLRIKAPTHVDDLAWSPDGWRLAIAQDKEIHLHDVTTGELIQPFGSHRACIREIVFSKDGKNLASSSYDTTVLLWQVPSFAKTRLPAARLSVGQLTELWQDLEKTDARRAYESQMRLETASGIVAFLGEHVKPVAWPDSKQLARWIEDLGNDNYKVRQKAQGELEKIDDLAEHALHEALQRPITLEAHQRIQQILRREKTPATGQQLPTLRAIEVLEWIGTPEARAVVARLAQGAPGARITTEAQATLRRMVNN